MQEDLPDQPQETVPPEQQRLLISLHEHNFKNWKLAQESNPNNTRRVMTFLALWKMSHDSFTVILGKEEVQKGSLGWDPYVEEKKLLAKTSNGYIGLNQNPLGLNQQTPTQELNNQQNHEPVQSTSSAGPIRNDNRRQNNQPYKKAPQAEEDAENMHSMLAFSKAYYRAVKGINKKGKGKKPTHNGQSSQQ
ncbi:uncharacterized protein MELLADRAFT_65704 [Melampsora larici-populina 98AG31]|uniref:Uncharacterized protein n=1 Tax=Melampsora larici-populina (strain 98AG31 / pathotype 3-4-7) TaxID=747676 RepID=F4RWE8_MELLP|nr:uncharacterized protein MELLADRAFT_65704 [Melampsora larici-populina 98AG31]EGG03334.1 hypothetical protein MELLADRAFT_65704 [Melampsora larici-populina 98AG31]